MVVLCLRCCEGFPLAAESRDCSSVAVRGLLIAVISLAALGHLGVSNCGTRASVIVAHGLRRCGSPALEHRLSS